MSREDWWRRSVFYQVYPRSFLDANGDGIGDLEGIRKKLGYIKDVLGADCVWLSPIFPDGGVDFGYDIKDYEAVNPIFGDLQGFRDLIRDAKSKGLRVILDGVFNHTSDKHKWFQAARSSKDSPFRNYYIWRPPGKNGRAPNNWSSAFGPSAWTLDKETKEYYLHSYAEGQPDLNWRNPQVVQEILSAMKFWLDLGVDGFRLDVFNRYLKDSQLRSNPWRYDLISVAARFVYPFRAQVHKYDRDQYDDMAVVLGHMRKLVDAHGGVLVGETEDELNLFDNAGAYVGRNQLQMTFNFRLLQSRWAADSFEKAITSWVKQLEDRGAWPSWVIDNHDQARSFTRWSSFWSQTSSLQRAKAAALLLLTLRGTAFIYQGQEIGMEERRMKRSEILDPPGKRYWPFFQGRDGCRTPMQWNSSSRNAGFSTADKTWLPINKDFMFVNVNDEQGDPDSLLGTYRELIKLRRAHPALLDGAMEFRESSKGKVLIYSRHCATERLLIHVNMSSKTQPSPLNQGGELLFSTSTLGGGQPAPLTLDPYEALIVRTPSTKTWQPDLPHLLSRSGSVHERRRTSRLP